jgi:hypothetical protein
MAYKKLALIRRARAFTKPWAEFKIPRPEIGVANY